MKRAWRRVVVSYVALSVWVAPAAVVAWAVKRGRSPLTPWWEVGFLAVAALGAVVLGYAALSWLRERADDGPSSGT